MKCASPLILRTTAIFALSAFASPAYSQAVSKSEAIPVENAPTKPAEKTPADEELIVLSPFELSSQKDTGYQATETLGGTRIRTQLKDVSVSMSVITKELLKDLGATDSGTLLQYTTNAEVAGTRGTYGGLGNATTLDQSGNLRAPGGAQRVRGLAPADNARDYFITDIPWDSYNVDRVEILRGPNAILYGLGSPAGIINNSTRTAEFRNMGEVTARVGSYGGTRATLDLNYQLIPGVLAVRFDGVRNNQKFEQKQAWQNDKRYFGSVRFDPQLFDRKDFQTSIKVKAEKGDIQANRPRIIPPYDSITPWFRPVDNSNMMGGMGKLVVNNPYDAWTTGSTANPIVAGDGRNLMATNSVNYQPWLIDQANAQQPYWLIDGTTNRTYAVNGGFINNGALYKDGTFDGTSTGLLGKINSGMFYGLQGLPTYINNANLHDPTVLKEAKYGQFRSMVLQDPTIFDFYHNLIDGPTKWEAEKWTTYNVDVSQTAWDGRLSLDLTYDEQKYYRASESLIGGMPAITLDIMKNFSDFYLLNATNSTITGRQDKATNANFGRPYVMGAGTNGGGSNQIDRKNLRASLFGELRAADIFDNKFLVKLLGKQRFNGVVSDEKLFNENRSWQSYANSQAWDAYWNGNDGSTSGISNRPPLAVIYLGPSVANRSSASGANIPGITSNVALQNSGIYAFDTTWKNYATTPGTPWAVPTSGVLKDVMYNFGTPPSQNNVPYDQWYQNSNPANYVGWNSNFQDNLLRYNNGQDLSLLTNAQKSLRETKSYSGSWQGYFWNNALVTTLGWRYDKVTTKDVTAGRDTLSRNTLNLQPGVYELPAGVQTVAGHSTSGGAVLHLNNLLPRDLLPLNVSLGYNESSNFSVKNVRRDVYGNTIGNPSGNTREYSALLSTKNGKYSLRVVKFTTKSFNGDSTLGNDYQLGGVIATGLAWRNVFLYQLGNYDWASRNQDSYRNRWTNAYPLNDPAAPNYDSTKPIYLQVNADADMNAAITTWNNIQKTLEGKGFFKAWNFNPTTSSVLVDRTTYLANPSAYVPDPATLASYSSTRPQGFAVTSDTVSKGYELELTANPLPNWRLSFNASKTTAIQNNVGGAALTDFVSYISSQLSDGNGNPTPAGKLPRYGGAGNAIYNSIWSPWMASYTLLKLQQGAAMPEIRKWRYNAMSNYDFNRGFLKGVGVGGAYRWQDKVAIGYPVNSTGAFATYDLGHPYYGPSEDAIDLWLSYSRKLSEKVSWKIQLNVYNVGKKDKLIPISIEPDGKTWAAARIAPVQEWALTNTFSF